MITDIYNKLTKEQQEFLNYAFENKITQLVELGNGKFIGVYINPTEYMTIEETENNWYIGRLNHGKVN